MLLPILVGWLLVLGANDFRSQRLPNAVTIPAGLGAIAGLAGQPEAAAAAVAAVLLGFGAYAVIAGCGGGGWGDAKLAVPLAVTLGAPAGGAIAAVGLLLVWLLVAAAATLGMAAVWRRRQVPHGPAMIAAWAVLVAAPP